MDDPANDAGTPIDGAATSAVTFEPAAPPRRTRTRLLAGLGAAMLVAAAGGIGFGIGRSVAPSDDVVRGADEPTATAAPDTAPPTAPAGTAPDTTIATPTTDAPVATEDVAAETAGAVDAELVASYGPTFDLVAERRTDDGTRVRVLLGPTHSSDYYGGPQPGSGWQPEPFCYGTREARITVDAAGVVDVTYGQWSDEPFLDVAIVALGDVGWADGRPLRLLVLQVPEATDELVVRWGDGASTIATVADGLAVALMDGTDSWSVGFEIEVAGAGEVTTLTQADLDPSTDPEWRAACVPPPPALPPAGEQPGDPDAERAAVTERFLLLWDQSVPQEDKPELLDDRTGVDEAVEAVFAGGFSEAAASAEHRVEELVFTSPTTAWFRYGIDTSNGYFGDRYGVAKLTDAGWIFPRALMCQDLSLAGGQCEPPAQPIYPPSWYEINGGLCTYPEDGGEPTCLGYDDSDIATWF